MVIVAVGRIVGGGVAGHNSAHVCGGGTAYIACIVAILYVWGEAFAHDTGCILLTVHRTCIVAVAHFGSGSAGDAAHAALICRCSDDTIVETARDDTGVHAVAGNTAHVACAGHIVSIVAVGHLVVGVLTGQTAHITGTSHFTLIAVAVADGTVVVSRKSAVVVAVAGNLRTFNDQILHRTLQITEETLIIFVAFGNVQTRNGMSVAIEMALEFQCRVIIVISYWCPVVLIKSKIHIASELEEHAFAARQNLDIHTRRIVGHEHLGGGVIIKRMISICVDEISESLELFLAHNLQRMLFRNAQHQLHHLEGVAVDDVGQFHAVAPIHGKGVVPVVDNNSKTIHTGPCHGTCIPKCECSRRHILGIDDFVRGGLLQQHRRGRGDGRPGRIQLDKCGILRFQTRVHTLSIIPSSIFAQSRQTAAQHLGGHFARGAGHVLVADARIAAHLLVVVVVGPLVGVGRVTANGTKHTCAFYPTHTIVIS